MNSSSDISPPLEYVGYEEIFCNQPYAHSSYSKYFPELRISQLTKAERAEIKEKIDAQNVEIYFINKELENRKKLAENNKDNYSTQLTKDEKAYPLMNTDICPQCKYHQMNTYKVNDSSYFCICTECRVCGYGSEPEIALEDVHDTIWKGNFYHIPKHVSDKIISDEALLSPFYRKL